jgi:hypothetical protein
MTAMQAHARGLTTVDRAAAAFLLALMAVGSLVLWIGVPAGWLWVAGKITSDGPQHIMLSILGAPIAIIGWARFLFWLNRLYLRVTVGAWAVEADPDADEDDAPRWVRGPLEPLLVGSLVIAIIALFYWFFVYAENPGAWVF